jgi:periplasmic protein CpxP/Spy
MMKRTILFLSLILLVFSGSFAQPPQGGGGRFNPEERQKQQLEMMKKELSLTPEQTTKVEALNKETGEKMRALFEANSGDRDKAREKMRAVREESDTKLKAILTAEQYTKWQEIEKKMREERRGNRPQGGPGDPGGPGPDGGQRGGQRGGGDQ